MRTGSGIPAGADGLGDRLPSAFGMSGIAGAVVGNERETMPGSRSMSGGSCGSASSSIVAISGICDAGVGAGARAEVGICAMAGVPSGAGSEGVDADVGSVTGTGTGSGVELAGDRDAELGAIGEGRADEVAWRVESALRGRPEAGGVEVFGRGGEVPLSGNLGLGTSARGGTCTCRTSTSSIDRSGLWAVAGGEVRPVGIGWNRGTTLGPFLDEFGSLTSSGAFAGR